MTIRSLLRFCLVFMCGSVVSACDGDYFSQVESLYSYIQVGTCKGGYYGDVYTPQGKISDCLGLLTTAVSLNVSQSTQTVTLIEEDLGFNKQPVTMRLSATKLGNCSIVDKSNFRCDGLERRDGTFVNTASIGWRRVSNSRACAIKAQYIGDGWVGDSTLTYHDSAWIVLAYVVGAVVLFGVVVGGL